ncbi:stonustoxin subunit alpha-like isoform X2 [Cheilinus undulatus]|uniref:stonustoxin subunit alpha-like isoform X2 n=1 Tax=Cheilinus undulatus TaxID=241271 RepID=UPI001BD5666D|nr:stonustoxin subunit alpha-like isoform X2 [Cheilinus undulatus]
MDQCEDPEEGVPPSTTSLCGEQEALRMKEQRPDSAGPSCVSMKSDQSKDFVNTKVGHPPDGRLDHGGLHRLTPGLRKYACEPRVDTKTVNGYLKLSDDYRTVTCVMVDQSYPDHPDRFDHWSQLLCRTGLTGRCYWEVEWRGDVDVSVSYKGIRRGDTDECLFGHNEQSWSLFCSDKGYSVCHNNRSTNISFSSSISGRVSVYVDCPAGSLSFYSISSDTLIHLHTFNTTFTEPLYPGFGIWSFGSSVSLCDVPVLETQDQLILSELSDYQLTEDELTEDQLTEDQLTEDELTEDELTEDQLTEDQLTL